MATEARPRKLWTKEEDAILRSEAEILLNQEGISNAWSLIASKLPSRTNKDCRKRFTKIAKKVNKGAWEPSEDERLLSAVHRHGQTWIRVAQDVQTRHADQCAKRWQQSLDPNLIRAKWKPDEDQRLLQAVEIHGRKWKTIAETTFPGRSTTDLKNRYSLLTRERSGSTNQEPPRSVPTDIDMDMDMDSEFGDDCSDFDLDCDIAQNFLNGAMNESPQSMPMPSFPSPGHRYSSGASTGSPSDPAILTPADFDFNFSSMDQSQHDVFWINNRDMKELSGTGQGGEPPMFQFDQMIAEGDFNLSALHDLPISDQLEENYFSFQPPTSHPNMTTPVPGSQTDFDITPASSPTPSGAFLQRPRSMTRSKTTLVLEDVEPTTLSKLIEILTKENTKVNMAFAYEDELPNSSSAGPAH